MIIMEHSMATDPAVQITAMILMAVMSLLTFGTCVYAVKKEQRESGSMWWLLAIASGIGTASLWGGIAKLAGITLG